MAASLLPLGGRRTTTSRGLPRTLPLWHREAACESAAGASSQNLPCGSVKQQQQLQQPFPGLAGWLAGSCRYQHHNCTHYCPFGTMHFLAGSVAIHTSLLSLAVLLLTRPTDWPHNGSDGAVQTSSEPVETVPPRHRWLAGVVAAVATLALKT